MRKVIFLFFALMALNANAVNWNNAQWLWQQEDGPSNTWMCFRKTVTLDEVPSQVEALISVDSKFWMWINGEMVVIEGGLSRGPSPAGAWDRAAGIMPTNSWYQTVDIQPYLKEGENTIAVLTWFWGRQTNKGTHIDSKKGGFLFNATMGEKVIVSDSSWKALQHPGYDNTIEPIRRLVQYSVKYDAQTVMNDWTNEAWYTNNFDDASWPAAVEKGGAGVAPWYDLIESYVPRLINHGLKDYENNTALSLPMSVSSSKVITCQLPLNLQLTPYLEVEAEAGKIITIKTDNELNEVTATYTTKGGTQQFESYSWMSGHEVKYTIPAGVTVKALKYRWMSVGEMAGSYEVDDPFYQRLWEMGNNTLFVCARDNFMDCPDRERGLWIGDVADQTGYLFYCMDNAGRQLLKKAVLQTMYFSDNKVIGALGPARAYELVGQSLQFIAQSVWPYYYNTGDLATLEEAYPYVYEYLTLFRMGSNGLPVYRLRQSDDTWDWLDWGVDGTIDKRPMQPAYYYQALVTAKKMAETLGKSEHLSFYNSRINSIANNYDKELWRNGYYSSDGMLKDDRLNALAITTGLAKPENYKAIVRNVLIPNQFSSPHFEWIVEEAMFIAGQPYASLKRMKERYQSQVNSGLSTLYEMFPNGGTYNHAWNGTNTILSKYVAGIKPTAVAWSEYEVCPNLLHMSSLKTKVPSVKGDIWVDISHTDSLYKLALISPDSTTAIVGIPKARTEIFDVKAGGQIIWKNEAFVEGVQGITFDSEDDDFLRFKVEPGTWNIEASIKRSAMDFDPEIAFITPSADTTLQLGYESLDVKVNATDDNGVQTVELYLNDTLISSKTEAPYAWSSADFSALSDLSLGSHLLKALVIDTEGKSMESNLKITVLKKSEGSVIGTPGSHSQYEIFDAVEALFDGDISTFFDTSTDNKDNAWGGLDFGENAKKTITKVGLAMRSDNADNVESHWKKRITGLKFYGANQIDFEGNTINAVDTAGNLLFEVTGEIAANMKFAELKEFAVTSPHTGGYRYGLVFFAPNSYGNAAEIVFTGNTTNTNNIVNQKRDDFEFNSHFDTNQELVVNYCLKAMANVRVSVFDISGRVISVSTPTLEQLGEHCYTFNNLNATNGVYIVDLEINDVSYTQKVIK